MDRIDDAIDNIIGDNGHIYEATRPEKIYVVPQKHGPPVVSKKASPSSKAVVYPDLDPEDVPYRYQRKGEDKLTSFLTDVPESESTTNRELLQKGYSSEEASILAPLLNISSPWLPKDKIEHLWNNFKHWAKSRNITNHNIVKHAFKRAIDDEIKQPTPEQKEDYEYLQRLRSEAPKEFANKMLNTRYSTVYSIMKNRDKLVGMLRSMAAKLSDDVAHFLTDDSIKEDVARNNNMFRKWKPVISAYADEIDNKYDSTNYDATIGDQEVSINLIKNSYAIDIIVPNFADAMVYPDQEIGKTLLSKIRSADRHLKELLSESMEHMPHGLEIDPEPVLDAILSLDKVAVHRALKIQFLKKLTNIGLKRRKPSKPRDVKQVRGEGGEIERIEIHGEPKIDISSADYIYDQAMNLVDTGRSNRISSLLSNFDKETQAKLVPILQQMGAFKKNIIDAINTEYGAGTTQSLKSARGAGIFRAFDIIRHDLKLPGVSNSDIKEFVLDSKSMFQYFSHSIRSIVSLIDEYYQKFSNMGMNADIVDIYRKYSYPSTYGRLVRRGDEKPLMIVFERTWENTESGLQDPVSPDSDEEEEKGKTRGPKLVGSYAHPEVLYGPEGLDRPLFPSRSELDTMSNNLAKTLVNSAESGSLSSDVEIEIMKNIESHKPIFGLVVRDVCDILSSSQKPEHYAREAHRTKKIDKIRKFIYSLVIDANDDVDTKSITQLVDALISDENWDAINLLINNKVSVAGRAPKDLLSSAFSTMNKRIIEWAVSIIKSIPTISSINLRDIDVNVAPTYWPEFDSLRHMGMSNISAAMKMIQGLPGKSIRDKLISNQDALINTIGYVEFQDRLEKMSDNELTTPAEMERGLEELRNQERRLEELRNQYRGEKSSKQKKQIQRQINQTQNELNSILNKVEGLWKALSEIMNNIVVKDKSGNIIKIFNPNDASPNSTDVRNVASKLINSQDLFRPTNVYSLLDTRFSDIKSQMPETAGQWSPKSSKTASWYDKKLNQYRLRLKDLIAELSAYHGKKLGGRMGDPGRSGDIITRIANDISDDPELEGLLNYVNINDFSSRPSGRSHEDILSDVKRVYSDFKQYKTEYDSVEKHEIEMPELESEMLMQKAAQNSVAMFPFEISFESDKLQISDRSVYEYKPDPLVIDLVNIDTELLANNFERHMGSFPHTRLVTYEKVPFREEGEIKYYLSQEELAYLLGALKPYQGEKATTNIKRFGMIIGATLDMMKTEGHDIRDIVKSINIPMSQINFWYDNIAKPNVHEKEAMSKRGGKQQTYSQKKSDIEELMQAFPDFADKIQEWVNKGTKVEDIITRLMAVSP